MQVDNFNIKGLTDQQVEKSRAQFGVNLLEQKKDSSLLNSIKEIIKEPMVLLLLCTAIIYFISGKAEDGIFMIIAIILVTAISLKQESKSRNALRALKSITQPKAKVIRNGKLQDIETGELVLGDAIMVEEGKSIPADGVIIHSNDFSVNESIITGESLPVYKSETDENKEVYMGSLVSSGLAICTVTAIGNLTKLGKIGISLESIKEEKTPLQIQIYNFVKTMAIVGIIVFLIVWGINYYQSKEVLNSLLKAMTLAMSILPEEIPVAFSTFMALGAWRLMKQGIIVKHTTTVEALGSANIICTDKTGTITQNKMTLSKVFILSTQEIIDIDKRHDGLVKDIIRTAMWASEPIPFDPMEVALHNDYTKNNKIDERPDYKLVHEYPLEGRPPMMTHVFENNVGDRIISAKGAPEALMQISKLSSAEIKLINKVIEMLAREGYRILGVGMVDHPKGAFLDKQQDYSFHFKGLLAFYDPPKENIGSVFNAFEKAGIQVKIITGDNAATTTTILKKLNFKGNFESIDGDKLISYTDAELDSTIEKTDIFARMFPEAKLRVINALKSRGNIVAMTGDGVNDGPALKAAHIGIAMGKKGSEIAKQASSLILVEDDLEKMIDAIAMGRKIYSNLKKAIQYIISIHIPIILTVFIPLALGWIYPNIFTPVHIIFLELIMGPTCSIIYENEPMEKNTMAHKPRKFSATFFNLKELTTSIIQGIIITLGVMAVYQYAVHQTYDENTVRTMVFLVLISANIFLTLVNRSFHYSIFTTIRYKNNLVPLIIGLTILLVVLLLLIPYLQKLFQFSTLDMNQLAIAVAAGFISVIWFEGVKLFRRIKSD